MRILWVKAGGLFPPDTGGKIRSFNLLKELSRNHQITFVSAHVPHAGDRHQELQQWFHRVIHLPLANPPRFSPRDYVNYARSLFSPLPYSLAKARAPHHLSAVSRLAEQGRFDVLVCDFVFAGTLFPWRLSVPKILFCHNVEAQIWRRHFEIAQNPLWRLVTWIEYQKMRRTELDYARRADHVLTVSELDREFFSRFVPAEKTSALPTGVDVDYFQPQPVAEQAHRLVFSGSMDWMPNEDAIIYFAEQILPRVAASVPGLEILVVGRRPTPALERLAKSNAAIRLTGSVSDIRPHVASGAVYVVPLRVGGGTRVKIFEAMAMGKAVVSTTIGAEGLPVTHAENILLADSPADFSDAVSGLLKNKKEREALGRAARELVVKRYSWERVGHDLEELLFSLTTTSVMETRISTALPATSSKL